jgi:hypothetical protein
MRCPILSDFQEMRLPTAGGVSTRRRLSHRKAGRLLIIRLGLRRSVGRVLGFALELQGGGHGGYSNRPITTIEVYVGTLGVLIGGPGRLLLGHFDSMELFKP